MSMKNLPIVTLPSSNLRERSTELTRTEILDPKMQQFIADMVPAMYGDDGIGLAAPQVDCNIRVCIIGKEAINSKERPEKTAGKKSDKKDLVLINPVYQKLSKKFTSDTEGCLSVPGYYGTVKRYAHIYVTALNEKGETIEFEAKDFFARVIQHEVDHLNGTLFIDRATDLYGTKHKKQLDSNLVLDSIREV